MQELLKKDTQHQIEVLFRKISEASSVVETDDMMLDDTAGILIEAFKSMEKTLDKICCNTYGGHKPIWYNPGGDEPNMTCIYCGHDMDNYPMSQMEIYNKIMIRKGW